MKNISLRSSHPVSSAYFSIFWSNKCETLRLVFMYDVGAQWCNDLIDNCDGSGIKKLRIGNVTFDYDTMDVKQDSTKGLLKN